MMTKPKQVIVHISAKYKNFICTQISERIKLLPYVTFLSKTEHAFDTNVLNILRLLIYNGNKIQREKNRENIVIFVQQKIVKYYTQK